jgi:glycosyltransferase involved in cell wall biosynthesis
MNEITFHVVLPTIGRHSMGQAVSTVINQDYKNWHLTIIGDGIVPLTFEHPQITHFNLSERTNDSGATPRNYVVNRSTYDWIAYIDDDDQWLPNHLSIIAKAIQENDGWVDMVRTRGRSFKWKHRHPRSSKLVKKLGPVSDDIMCVGMAHTRAVFEKTRGWQNIPDIHDRVLWSDMASAGGLAVALEDVTFEFER